MTPVRSVTPMVAVAILEPSARLVALMVNTPGEEGAMKVTAWPVVLFGAENDPPPIEDQETPALVVSLVSVAVTVSFCERVSPPRAGETLTVMLEPEVAAEAVFE